MLNTAKTSVAFRNASDDRILSAILERWGIIICPPWLLTLEFLNLRDVLGTQGGKYKYSGFVLEYNSSTSTKYYISAIHLCAGYLFNLPITTHRLKSTGCSNLSPYRHLHLTTSKVMVTVWRLRGNIIWTVLYWQRATSSMGTVNKNSSHSPVGPWVCLCFLGCMIYLYVHVCFVLP